MTSPALAARRLARELMGELGEGEIRFSGVDLRPALEQQLFFTLRDGRVPPPGGLRRAGEGLAAAGRPLAAAAVAGAVRWRAPSPGPAPLVVLVREATHYPVLQQIEAELQAVGGESLVIVRVGRAAAVPPHHAAAPRLSDVLQPRRALRLLAFERGLRGSLQRLSAGWDRVVGRARAGQLRVIARVELGRIALGAAGLLSVVDAWRPSLLAAFDEIGTWARLLPEVASLEGVPSLDLPHAEAADAAAISGVAYDRMAVYGPRAADVLRSAGYPADRIVEIGAPRFDPLVHAARAAPRGEQRRVVFAAQYVTGAMRRATLDACYRAALAAAAAAGASELLVVPHPAEEPGTAASLAAAHPAPAGVRVQQARPGSLHDALRGAWLLVTGWSNSVFEAAVAGIPALTVNPDGVAPVDFAADGLSLGADDEESAAAVARSLADPGTRAAAVERARRVAAERLGVLDGRASERAARLMLEMAAAGRGATA